MGDGSRRDFIYLGSFEPGAGIVFLKAGMSRDPKRRIKDYGGTVPGGLTSMKAVEVPAGDGADAERRFLRALAAISGLAPVGGEWFRCNTEGAHKEALQALSRVGGDSLIDVRPWAPEPAIHRLPRREEKPRESVSSMLEQRARWREIAAKERAGMKGYCDA